MFRSANSFQQKRCASSCVVLLFSILLVVGCSPRQDNRDQIRIVELQAENQRIKDELKVIRARMHEISLSRQGLMSQQVINQPVLFEGGGETLQEVRDRQILRCGGNADLPGFGYLDPDSSEFVGLDIDICRAIGAAVLGEQGSDQYEITPLTSKLRFTALQAGDVDLLSRNTTWTLSRDTELHVNYAGVIFYDGQGVMVRKSSNIRKLSDLRSKAICVQAGSTSANNVIDYFENIGISIEVQQFDDRVAAFKQYSEGGCDAYTGDKSSLLAQKLLLADPSSHQILVEDMSREPLGPVVRHEDENWADVVGWTIQCLINAEALDVGQDNVEEQLVSDNLAIKRLLGLEGDLGKKMGLPNDFCFQVIRQIGNYEDIYNRHLGPRTEFNLPRGLNALYSDGGLLYPLPFK